MDFYVFLEKIMDERNLSIPDIARMSGLSDSTIRSAIDRKQKRVALDVALKLSAGLNVPVEEINGNQQKEKPATPKDGELTDKEREYLRLYRAAPPEMQEAFLAALEAVEAKRLARDSSAQDK